MKFSGIIGGQREPKQPPVDAERARNLFRREELAILHKRLHLLRGCHRSSRLSPRATTFYRTFYPPEVIAHA